MIMYQHTGTTVVSQLIIQMTLIMRGTAEKYQHTGTTVVALRQNS